MAETVMISGCPINGDETFCIICNELDHFAEIWFHFHIKGSFSVDHCQKKPH